MADLWQDLRYGMRALLKAPGFTAVAVLTLALGIGANATIFSWLSAILLDPLPGVPRSREIIALFGTSRAEPQISVSYPDFRDFRDRTRTFSGLMAQDEAALTLTTGGAPERVWGQIVTGNFFDVLQVRALHGRTFRPGEDRTPGTHPVVVISHGLWQRRLGADPGIVGRAITLNNHAFTVIGITPPDFDGSISALGFDVWVPMMMQPLILQANDVLESRGNRWLVVLGRLKPGVSLQSAEAETATIAADLARAYPTNEGVGVFLAPIWRAPDSAQEVMGPVLGILMGVVAVVLLIACANVANLLLARATGRRREIAIRRALGASRWRLSRQVLTESVLLALVAGGAGVAIAYGASDLLKLLVPPAELPIHMVLGVDGRVLGFALAVSLLAGLLFGMAPALHAGRSDLVTALNEEAGSVAGGGRRKGWVRGALVVSQVTLSLVLLIAAGLLVRSLQKARSIELGFNPKSVLLVGVDLFPNGYEAEAGKRFYAELRRRVEALPGVRGASLSRRVPLGFGGSSSTTITVEGYRAAREESVWSFYYNVGPGYFRTLEIPLARGRDFTPLDGDGAQRVAVVNETLAARYWKGQDPIGRRVDAGSGWATIVGVVRDSKYRDLNERPSPMLFLPVAQAYRPNMNLVVRTEGDPMGWLAAVRGEIRALDPNLPIFNVRRFEDHIKASSFRQRMGASLLSVFGALALVLAGVGLYGVVAYAVSQRTKEIGIRVALGAERGDIVRLVLAQGMRLAALGVALGLGAAWGVTGLLRSLLFGVSTTDVVTFSVLPVVLIVVALVACWVPARRATRVDPVVALRHS